MLTARPSPAPGTPSMSRPQTELATQFHALHHDGLLLLANAWDAGDRKSVV